MTDFHASFIKAMDKIEDAQLAGHVVGPATIFAKYRHQAGYLNKLKFGITTHPLFEQCLYSQQTYALKCKKSASQAIESLLQEGETFIECGVATNIAYYLNLLWAMQETHGKEKGNERFDAIFGSEAEITPENRRLVISPFSIAMGTIPLPIMKQLPVQPLSFIFSKKYVSTKNELEQVAEIGAHVLFAGDQNYPYIHPSEHHGAYCCLITSINPIKIRSFDLGKQELIEEDLYHYHIKAYAEKPSIESMQLLNDAYRGKKELFNLIPKSTAKEKISGFELNLYCIDKEKYKFLLTGEIQEVVQTLNQYIVVTQEKVQKQFLMMASSNLKILAQSFETLIITPDKNTSILEKNKDSFLPSFSTPKDQPKLNATPKVEVKKTNSQMKVTK